MTRRERIARLERIGFAAHNARDAIAAALPGAPFPSDLAHALGSFETAARTLAEYAEREIKFLEESSDWAEGGGA